jgi:hypothetical protein
LGGGDAKKDLLSAVGAPSLHDLSRQLYGLYCGIGRPRQVSVDLHILRFTGMRLESVATLRVRNLYREWGLRGAAVKGGKTRDIPLPASGQLEIGASRKISRDQNTTSARFSAPRRLPGIPEDT